MDFLKKIIGRLLKIGLPLAANVVAPLSKGFLIPLELTAAVSPADEVCNWNLRFVNEEM